MNAAALPAFQNALKSLDKPFFPVDRRRAALTRFAAQGFPTTRLEAWRHTDASEAVSAPFSPARLLPLPPGVVGRYDLPGESVLLVFVNGFFSPAASDLAHLPEGVEAGPLSLRPEVPALGQILPLEDAPFAALNTALFPDGAYLRLTRGAAVPAPIHLLFLTLPDAGATLVAPRALILAEENSEAVVVETHAGGAAAHLSAAATEIRLDPAARITRVRRTLDVGAGAHVGHTRVLQARGSVYRSTVLTVGGKFVRHHETVVQEGEGAESVLDGVVLARGRELVDNQTVIDHVAPRGVSREAYKYLLSDRARGVFNGEVVIRPGASRADSAQINANLLLSDQALMHTKPDLRIFTDDVKAKHGATIGRLNADMLFYCRSRGLSVEEAKRLLTQAFASDILDRVPHEGLRELCRSSVGAWWEAGA